MRRGILILIISLVTVFSSHEKLAAYHSDVHKNITMNTIDQMYNRLEAYFKDYIGEKDYLGKKIWGKSIRLWIEDGSVWEDISINPIELLTSHFHNPLTNKGLTELGVVIGESAYDRANNPANSWSWQKARENLYKGMTLSTKTESEKALAKTFEALGHLVHLVQDMSVPAHTRDDMHVPYVKDQFFLSGEIR